METYQEKINMLRDKSDSEKARTLWNWIKAGYITKNEFMRIMDGLKLKSYSLTTKECQAMSSGLTSQKTQSL